MKTLVIVAHPDYEESTTQRFFRNSLLEFKDITWEQLDTDFEVEHERELLTDVDRVVLQFPLYWYSAPALMKSYLDEVFTYSYALGSKNSMRGKQLAIVVTTGDPEHDFQAGAREHFTMSELLRPFEAMAAKMGMEYMTPFIVYQFAYKTEIEQELLLIDYQRYITGDNNDSFKGKEAWYDQRLYTKIEKTADDDRKLSLDGIRQVLRTNMDTLDELDWALRMMKNDDGEE